MQIYSADNISTTSYKGYTIDMNYDEDSCQVYNNSTLVYECSDVEEAREFINDEIESASNDEIKQIKDEPHQFVASPKSTTYEKYIASHKDKLAWVLQYNNNPRMYYSRNGLVDFADNKMIVYLDKDTAENALKFTRGEYKVVKLK